MRTSVLRAANVIVPAMALGMAVAIVLPALPASARNSPANIKALTDSINRAKHLTYEAQYTSVTNGQTNTVTIAQSPPKSNFSTSSGSVINNGKSTYYCNSASSSSAGSSGNSGNSGGSGSSGEGSVTCISSKGSNPLLGIEDAFSPALALNALGQARQTIIARALGIKVSYSTASFAGQPSTCASVNVRGRTAKYCVTKQGILSYSGSGSAGYFELTKYSSTPSANLFALPAGATTATLPTLPGGSSISVP